MTGAKMVIEALKREGVEVLFGYPGGAILDIYDELYKTPDLKHVLVRHEQGATHAADGYARSTGKVGVVLVTSGPGATNTVTGIATAYMDSIPIVVLTGQVPTRLIGNDAFQEVDITGITRPITKHNFLVKRIEDLPTIIKAAFYIAKTGRPGPVLVDIPKDIQQAKGEFNYPEEIKLRSYNPVYEPHIKQIERAYQLLENAERPVLMLGGGIISANASEEARKLAEKLKLPVVMTLMGLSAFPGDHEQSLGMLGMHGTYYANMAVANCDVLLAVGVRFDDRVTGKVDAFAPGAKIIHIDIDPSSIQKNVKVDVPIVADCKRALKRLLEFVKQGGKDKKYWEERFTDWWEQINIWKRRYPLTYKQEGDYIKPQFVIEKLWELTKGEAIIATEVGQNQMWTALFYKFKHPRSLITSGGLGTMGFGFPAAIGAQIGNPDKLVIDIAGDGSIQMNIQELATAVEQRLPIKIIILNNGFLGMVRQWQELFYGKRYSAVKFQVIPDFVKLAEAYGAVGMRITRPEEVEPALKKVLQTNSLVILDIHIAPEEGVFPMVPAGKATTEMILL
ncbi:MAG: Acetolactate synthase [Thermodesulfobacterium sp. 37_54]|uniref:Acetolactate synthase n=1 Tax=Thermodesulfobacterium commune DSM 2178 TaxID=289377 RepID=A0A075WV02_9BACT|nr:acetolactate synthase catalytic subunit [Thermodesulfobacterium commune DSM 2178]KUJ97393.1 MAG: Acetolactate synthase [Thermodesulfobacterium sp. 37_54]HBT04290.1 biosynthetic-type acetolactate synthase large subunit [Thermodesulfobacterium commune]HCE80450.1 biosynthetic-type acetolactate synthase large subunit [Thermodesulfobacterium commune]HCP09278.1 biosynthetic-type acetolactate synthase large subunit [Thermodesulfobacterium commune]